MLLASTSQSIEIGKIAMTLCGGLALFLFGMNQLADALKNVAGDGLKSVLARLTSNRFTAVFAGAFVTSIIQSSSVTTVLVVGFISAGLMTLSQSIGVILGADIGTTVTAQIVAFKVTQYALIPVAVGFVLLFCFKKDRVRHYGLMIMGLGLIFYGMQLMSDGAQPLRTYQPFVNAMQRVDHPIPAIIIAAVFTAIIQSSSATMGVVIVLAGQGLISLEAGIALALGANIGTCVTAMLASIGKPREAVRAGLVHVLFKVGGVLLWLPFITQLAELTTSLSPSHEALSGGARLAAESPRQIANAHTIFNVANMLVFIWFTGPLASLMEWLIPDRKEVVSDFGEPKYLDEILLQTPVAALDTVRMELGRLGLRSLQMVRAVLDTVVGGSPDELDRLESMDNDVDRLHGAIVTYLGRLSRESLTDGQSRHLHDYLAAANYIEDIGDMIETNLVASGRNRLELHVAISPETRDVLSALHQEVCWSVERAVKAIVDNDEEAAGEVMAGKSRVNSLAEKAESHLAQRLAADETNRLATFRLESEIVEYLKRMYYFAKRIAKIVGGEENAGFESKDADADRATNAN